MNETERDLRELFEAKAREAGAAPRVTRAVLRRGRRRQAGTVAVAGIAALALAAAAVVSAEALQGAGTDAVPGGTNGNPSFTATIQNFTLTVPEGWTLIDQWPLGANMAVAGTSGGSCVAEAVPAGDEQTAQAAPSPIACIPGGSEFGDLRPTAPEGGLPMLTLSNDDPGLGGSVCDAGGSLPGTSATLYIALDYGTTLTTDWARTVPAWPIPLGNVFEGDAPPEEMPCGPGGYSRFQAGGVPFIAWAGFGSEATDADLQAVIDAFNSMRVSDGEIAPPSTDLPGYVLTGGTIGDTPWSLEAAPGNDGAQMSITHLGQATYDDSPVTFTLAGQGLQAATTVLGSTRISWGAVVPGAEGVEFRPGDGGDAIEGTLLRVPGSLAAPYDAFIVLHDAARQGRLVVIGPDGDLGGADTVDVTQTAEDRQVQADLRNAYVAAKTYFTDTSTYEGFTPKVALSIEPSLGYNTAARAVPGEVSIRDLAVDHIVLAEATETGNVFCLAENGTGLTTYGAVDPQTAAGCTGGETAWGMDATASPPVPVESSAATSPPVAVESSVDLPGFQGPATLTVRRDPGSGCLTIAIALANTGVGTCVNGRVQTDRPFITMQSVDLGDTVAMVSGYVPAGADRVFLVSDDGRRFGAPTLFILDVEPRVRFFAFAVAVTSGRLHIQDGQGIELNPPLQLTAEP
ncbi:MAG: hypothetical protein ABJC60_03900 [Actinomycetota bacterium]